MFEAAGNHADLPGSETTGVNQGSDRDGAGKELVTLRGLVDLFTVAMLPPDSPRWDAPHRRLAAKLRSGEEVTQEDVATWFLATHHDAMGAHRVNCSAAWSDAGSFKSSGDHKRRRCELET